MKIAIAELPRAARRRESLFYCVELFDKSGLAEVQFFDSNELDRAKVSAIASIQSGAVETARVIDDGGRLVP